MLLCLKTFKAGFDEVLRNIQAEDRKFVSYEKMLLFCIPLYISQEMKSKEPLVRYCKLVAKALNSVYGELPSVCMKKLILQLWIYQKIAAIFNISDHRFTLSRIHQLV